MLYIPTRTDIESLTVGDMAMDCFGHMRPVAEVNFRGIDLRGKAYVDFRLDFGPHSTITQIYREDELVRHVGTQADGSLELERLDGHAFVHHPREPSLLPPKGVA